MPLLMCDLDDTLVQRAPLFRTWATGFLADHELEPDLVDWLVEEDRGGHRSREEFVAAVTDRTGRTLTRDTLNDALPGSYRLTTETRAALDDALAAGYTLAVITNGPTEAQSRKVRAAGLDRLAAAVCISEEVGVAKPDPLIFRTAAERAGLSLDGAWMVGDNLDADIAGGAAVGARTAWVRPAVDWLTFEGSVRPDLVADSFDDAVSRLLAVASRS